MVSNEPCEEIAGAIVNGAVPFMFDLADILFGHFSYTELTLINTLPLPPRLARS